MHNIAAIPGVRKVYSPMITKFIHIGYMYDSNVKLVSKCWKNNQKNFCGFPKHCCSVAMSVSRKLYHAPITGQQWTSVERVKEERQYFVHCPNRSVRTASRKLQMLKGSRDIRERYTVIFPYLCTFPFSGTLALLLTLQLRYGNLQQNLMVNFRTFWPLFNRCIIYITNMNSFFLVRKRLFGHPV